MIRRVKWIAGVIVFALISVSVQAQQIDVQHYKFRIELNDNNDTIYGKAEITVKFLESVSSVEFDLIQAGTTKKGMFVTGLSGLNVDGKKADLSSNKCRLNLTRPAMKNDTATYTITYKGIPADGLIISKNKYGQRTFFADNWPDRGRNWLPCVDNPADKASVEFIVTAPEKYRVVANGILEADPNSYYPIGKKVTHWKEDVPISTKVMVIGVADFAVQQAGMVDNSIPVSSWVYPQDSAKGFYDYAQAVDILPFYIKHVGPYGYKKLANVESKTIFGGLENANTIFYSENSISGQRKSEGLLTHEIAHQWFGNMATEKSFAHLWLSEGFATYMTILYMEEKYGKDTARKMIEEDRQQVIEHVKTSNRPIVDNTTDYMALLNVNSYQKGGWVLHMLRKELGDSVFWSGIRKYYSTYAGKTADTDDFRKIIEEASGKDLQIFFRQWLFGPGIPQLNIDWKYNATQKKIEIRVEQTQKNNLFQFPLEIGISLSDNKMVYKQLNITKATESFTIDLEQKPLRLLADPGQSLLFEGSLREIK